MSLREKKSVLSDKRKLEIIKDFQNLNVYNFKYWFQENFYFTDSFLNLFYTKNGTTATHLKQSKFTHNYAI